MGIHKASGDPQIIPVLGAKLGAGARSDQPCTLPHPQLAGQMALPSLGVAPRCGRAAGRPLGTASSGGLCHMK